MMFSSARFWLAENLTVGVTVMPFFEALLTMGWFAFSRSLGLTAGRPCRIDLIENEILDDQGCDA
jgi:hypothetical protein